MACFPVVLTHELSVRVGTTDIYFTEIDLVELLIDSVYALRDKHDAIAELQALRRGQDAITRNSSPFVENLYENATGQSWEEYLQTLGIESNVAEQHAASQKAANAHSQALQARDRAGFTTTQSGPLRGLTHPQLLGDPLFRVK